MAWRVATSLDVLLAEINASAPNRSKASDGSIGDAAHASRDSDHNPFIIKAGVGIVRARDFTHDPAGGFDCNEFAPRIAALMRDHPACQSGAYVIWNRRIWSADRDTEGWRTYTGSNPHDHHCHVSVTTDPNGFDSTARWLTTEDPDTMNPAQEERLVRVEQAVDRIEDTLVTILGAVRNKGENAWKRDVDIKKLVREVLAEVRAES